MCLELPKGVFCPVGYGPMSVEVSKAAWGEVDRALI